MNKDAKYNLTGRNNDQEAARDFFREVLRESYATWENPEAVSEFSYDEYFEPTMGGDGALYNNASLDRATLLISAEDFDEAEALFSRCNASVWIERLREQGDVKLKDDPSALHVYETGGLAHESQYPNHVTSFAPEKEDVAERLTEALEMEYDDKRYDCFQREGEELVSIFSGRRVAA